MHADDDDDELLRRLFADAARVYRDKPTPTELYALDREHALVWARMPEGPEKQAYFLAHRVPYVAAEAEDESDPLRNLP